MSNKTDIAKYSDSRSLLRALFLKKKGEGRGFGLQKLADRAGFKSPAALSMILNGKRNLLPGSAERLGKALSLSARNLQYLIALTQKEQAKTPEEILEAEERLFHLRSFAEETSISVRQYRALSIWFYSAIYTLAGMRDFRDDAVWVSRRLKRKVTPPQARKAIDDLKVLGLLRVEGDKLVQAEGAVTSAEDIRDLAIRKYHKKMISLADEALDLPLEKREMNGLTLGIPERCLPEAKARIRRFRKEMNEYFSQFQDAENVFQLNIQLFPLSEEEK